MQEGQNLQLRDKYVIDSSKPKEQGNIWRQKKKKNSDPAQANMSLQKDAEREGECVSDWQGQEELLVSAP